MNNDFKNFLKVVALTLIVGVTIATSSGSICYGMSSDPFYIITGILNFGWLYFPIREVVKYFKERNARKTADSAATVAPEKEQTDNKTDIEKR